MTEYFPQSNVNTNPKFHLYALLNDRQAYLRQLQVVRENGSWSSLSSPLKGTVLAALWMTRSHKVVQSIFMNEDCIGADLWKMTSILDKPRLKRQLAEKIKEIETKHPHVISTSDEDSGDNATSNSKKRKRKPNNGDATTKRKRQRKVDKTRRELRILEAAEKQLFDKDDGPWSQDSAVQELYDSSSVSGALARHIRRWAGTLKPDALEFVMLEIDNKEQWKQLADIVHFAPGDFTLPYFLYDIHGEPIPDDCFVSSMRKLLAFESADKVEFAELFKAAAEKFPQIYLSYPSLRLKTAIINNTGIVETLARHIPLEIVIWYFEEMYRTSKECANIVLKRLLEPGCLQQALASDAKVYSFGKLMERILMFQKMRLNQIAEQVICIATSKLSALIEKWGSVRGNSGNNTPKKLAVLGDASSSMQCAIEAATILAGFCSALLDGELIFFNHNAVKSPHPKPNTVEQLLDVCNKIRASGATSLASALGGYFETKVWFDAIVMVTDEEENTAWNGRFFAQLFKEYQQIVNPNAKLVIVCVGSGDHRFRRSLKDHGIEHTTIHIDEARPDLTKFGGLIGDIAYNSLGLANGLAETDSTEVTAEMDVESTADAGGEADGDFVLIE